MPDQFKEWILVVLELEGSTFAGVGNLALVALVFLVHRTETGFQWIARHITIRLGSWFEWSGREPEVRSKSLVEDLAAVMFFFVACIVVLNFIVGVRQAVDAAS